MNNTLIDLIILQINDQEEISYLYESQFNNNREKQVNLLLLENKNALHSPYYTSVKNLKSLLS